MQSNFGFESFQQTNLRTINETIKNPFFQSLGSNFGSKMIDMGNKYSSFVDKIFCPQTRFFFDLDSNYILNKAKILVCPFLFGGDWGHGGTGDYSIHFEDKSELSPVQNVHSVDLYIPFMSLMSFILMTCISIGINQTHQLDPQIIINSFWKCIIISFLELVVSKVVTMLYSQQAISSTELIGLLNYRYVTLFLYSMMRLVFFNYTIILYPLAIYILVAQFFFISKSLHKYHKSHKGLGIDIFFIISLIQPAFSWFILWIV